MEVKCDSLEVVMALTLGTQILLELGAFIDDLRFLGSKISMQVGYVPKGGNKQLIN